MAVKRFTFDTADSARERYVDVNDESNTISSNCQGLVCYKDNVLSIKEIPLWR